MQIPRMRRPSMGREVFGRADHNDLLVDAHANRNHVALERMAQADSCVETLDHDVRKRLVEGDLDADFGILGEKAPEDGPDHIRVAGAQHREAQKTGWTATHL